MDPQERPLVWLHDRIRSPPFSPLGRLMAGHLLRRLQQGEPLGMPHSRPMPGIGPHCHELRIRDGARSWRIVHRIDPDAIVILALFEKKTRKTPSLVIRACRQRLKRYEEARSDPRDG